MRTAIYLQPSSAASKQDTENQLTQLKAFAKKQGWPITKIYRERPTTRTTINENHNHKNGAMTPKNRAALLEMIEAARMNHFDVLLFWSLDGLAPRSGALPALNFLHQLGAWGIRYRSFSESYLDTTGVRHEAVVSILATLVKQESLRLSHLTRDGLKRQKREKTPGPNGHFGPGKPPVKFDHDKARKLREQGKPYATIAKLCGVSKATVFRFLNQ